MGLPLSPVMVNIYIEYFEEKVLGMAPLKPTVWLRYVNSTFILWLYQGAVQILLDHVNSKIFDPVHNIIIS